MIQYGLISQTDARTLEKTLDLICDEFNSCGFIHTCEIGVFDGDTSRGIIKYVNSKGRYLIHTAIDSQKDFEVKHPFQDQSKILGKCNFIIGNSNEVYNQLEDNSQHLILADGDHTLIGVISDFYAYADKVKVGGYFCFHDTGKHIKPFKDFQHGDKDNPDAYISVRRALDKIGLFSVIDAKDFSKFSLDARWQLIFDEADENNEAGGICVFKKLF